MTFILATKIDIVFLSIYFGCMIGYDVYWYWRNSMIQQFRKVPIIVEAIQFEQTYQNAQEIIDWVNAETKFDPNSGQDPPVMYYYGDLTIRTLEGDMHASKGDWIVKGDAGEFYPVKPEIFERTHKLVNPVISSDTVTDWGDDWSRYMGALHMHSND